MSFTVRPACSWHTDLGLAARGRYVSTTMKVWITGPPGAGKSWLARELSVRLGIPTHDLDSAYWRTGWMVASGSEFDEEVSRIVDPDEWIVDGFYPRATKSLTDRADVLIWLDPPAGLCIRRVIRRSLRRILSREELWAGNRESWNTLLGRRSMLLWAWTSRRAVRQTLSAAAAEIEGRGARTIRVDSPVELEWIQAQLIIIRGGERS